MGQSIERPPDRRKNPDRTSNNIIIKKFIYYIFSFVNVNFCLCLAFCDCPSSWQLKDKTCFKVVNSKKTWSNASADCKNQLRGAHLIYLNGRPVSFTDSLTNIQTKDYLVGAERKNDRWVWGNGIQVVKNFSKSPKKDEVYVVLQRKCSILSAKKSSFDAFYICESSNTLLNGKSLVKEKRRAQRW